MNRHVLTWLLLLLAFLGIADSWYLGVSEATGAPLTCTISGLNGCNAVAQSAWSHIFGIPFGLYGVPFYGLIFILGALLLFYPKLHVYRWLYYLGWLGLLASVLFVGIQFFIIKALCIYCLGSAVLCLFACLITLQLWQRHAPRFITMLSS